MMEKGSEGSDRQHRPGAGFARARRADARRAAYRRWRARVPIVMAGPRRRPLRPWPQRLLRAVLGAAFVFVLLSIGLIGVAAVLGGRSLVLPVWAVAEAESRLNAALDGEMLQLWPHRHNTDGFFAAVMERQV